MTLFKKWLIISSIVFLIIISIVVIISVTSQSSVLLKPTNTPASTTPASTTPASTTPASTTPASPVYYKATATPGDVEWGILYNYYSNGYRFAIDKRQFNNSVSPDKIKKLKLFDLWEVDITYSNSDTYWANYFISTPILLNLSNANIRQGNGFYGIKANFTFTPL